MKRIKFILLAAATWCLGSFSGQTFAQNWALISGTASDIGVGADGSVWSIGTIAEGGGYGIYKYNGSSFTKVPGGAVRIAVDPQGKAWVVNSGNDIFKYNGTNWAAVPGQKATDIAVGANGTVWAIGNVAESGGFGIYKMSGTTWAKIPGGAVRIAVDPHGNAWVVNSSNGIFKYNGSGWTTIAGSAKDIGIGANGSVWITGANGSISSWNGSAWELRTGGADHISVGPTGEPWVVNAQGQVYRGGDVSVILGETTNIATGLPSGSGSGSLKFPRQQSWEADMCKALGMTGVAANYAALTPFQQIIGTFGLDATEAYFAASGTPNLTPTEAMMKLNSEVVLVGAAGNVSTSIKSRITGIIGVLVVNHLKKNGSDAQSVALKEWATKIFRQIKVDAAIGTLKEYYVWKNNPCTYSAPGYTKPQECYGVVGNNPYASMWQTVSPPSDLLLKAGLAYATGNNDKIVKGVSAALSGVGLLFAFPAAASGLGITVAAVTTTEGTIPVLTALFAAFAPNSTVAVAVGGVANATAAAGIGATSWTGVVAGPAAVIIASALIGIVQGIVVIEGAQAEWKLKQAIRAAMSENINMANVVSETNTEALFMIGLVKSAQDGWKAPSLEIEGEVTFFCEAGYVSKFYLTYTLNGQSKSFSTNDMSTGFWQKFTIPAAAKNIQVKGVMLAAGEKTIFTQNLERPTYICYKVYGTVIQQSWNNDWPLSVGGEVSENAGKIKFTHGAGYVANWQITYDLPGKPGQNINPTGTSLGWNKTYNLPLDATNVRILIQGATGLVWEPWRTTYDKTFPTVPNTCIKIYGTTLDQKWNSDCN